MCSHWVCPGVLSPASAWGGASSHLLPEMLSVSTRPSPTQTPCSFSRHPAHTANTKTESSLTSFAGRSSHFFYFFFFKHTAPSSPITLPSVIARLCHHADLLARSIFNQRPVIAFISLPTLHSMLSYAHTTHTHTHIDTYIHTHRQTDRHAYIIGQYAERGHYINTVPEEAVYIRWTLIIFFTEYQ